MKQRKTLSVKPGFLVILTVTLLISCLAIYYLIPSERIPEGIAIDRILVYKSKHELQAFSNKNL